MKLAQAFAAFARGTQKEQRLEERAEREGAERDHAAALSARGEDRLLLDEAVERDEARERLRRDLGEADSHGALGPIQIGSARVAPPIVVAPSGSPRRR